MVKTTPEQKETIKLVDIIDKVADVKQQCTIAERYLLGFIHSWEMGIVSINMINEEINIVSDVVVNLNLDIDAVKNDVEKFREHNNKGNK